MKEQFDKRLVEKIKDSFENHEESFDPKAWESFSSAYFKPKKATSKFAWVLWAASIVAVLGLIMLFFPRERILSESEIVATNRESLPEPPGEAETLPPFIADIPESDGSGQLQLAEEIRIGDRDISEKMDESENQATVFDLPKIDLAELGNIPEDSEKNLGEIPLQVREIDQNQIGNPFLSEMKATEEKQAVDKIQAWLNDGKENEFQESQEEKEQKKPVRLGVLVSPQTISNSNQTLNLGAGLMSEISFSKRLKLDLGMAFASQNINPDGSDFMFAMDAQTEDVSRAANTNLSNNLINTNSELKFGQLEIPINLKFIVMDKKSYGLYLVSGVSNMVYVNQRTVNTFTAVNFNNSGLMGSQNIVETFSDTVRPSEGNSGSNIGQMVNFGFGYEHNLKNGTFISFEPFFKTSIGGQTFLGQQFSMGGMNLRMNFQLKK